MTIELVEGLNAVTVPLIPEVVEVFELIEDPKVTFRALSLPGGLIATDCFTGAELSVQISATYRATRTQFEPAVTFKSEYCLIKGSEAIPIGSHSMTMTGGISSLGFYITLPGEPGPYETMLRIYTNGVLTGQYPYLGPITVIPKGVSNFSYTKPYLRVQWDKNLPGYRYSVESTITNEGGSAEQRQVILWLREYSGPLSGRNQWRRMDEITLGLAPSGSDDYSGSGVLGMVGDNKFIAQLRDSDGGVSGKSNSVTAG